MHKLIIEDDEGKTVVVPLIRDEITVGRQEGNTVRLTEQNISRRHARFIREGGVLFVEDLGSHNGIKVNGALVSEKTALNDGDQILIGDYKLGLKVDDAAARTMAYGSASARARVKSDAPVAPTAPLPQMSPTPPAPAAAADIHERHDMIEGAPTIPVRTLADRGWDAGVAPPPTGRLVVMSTQLAGAEFLLDRASLVIGRTAENDIVLNHKSISRHHAKVIRDGERFVVVDLESANGVRVNGTQQERMVLDSGDVIELGHVRLKYLSGDDVLGAAGIGSLRGSKTPLFVGVGVAALVVVVAVFALSSGGDKQPVAEAPKPNTANAPNPTPPATAPAAEPAVAPEPAAAPAPAANLESAKTLFAQGQWDQSLAAIALLPAEVQSTAEAQTLKRQIAAERAAEAALVKLQVEAEAGRVEPARKLAAGVPAESRFAAKATELVDRAQSSFISARMNVAEGHRAAGRCDDARKEAERVLKVVPDEASATALIAACQKKQERAPERAVAKAPEPTVAATTANKKPARTTVATAPAPVAKKQDATDEEPMPSGDADDYIKEAQEAWLHGQFAAAIASSRKALRLKPGMVRAYQIIAVCSCSLRDQNGATKAYERLDDKNRQMVRSLCEKNGVNLPE